MGRLGPEIQAKMRGSLPPLVPHRRFPAEAFMAGGRRYRRDQSSGAWPLGARRLGAWLFRPALPGAPANAL